MFGNQKSSMRLPQNPDLTFNSKTDNDIEDNNPQDFNQAPNDRNGQDNSKVESMMNVPDIDPIQDAMEQTLVNQECLDNMRANHKKEQGKQDAQPI